MPDSETTKLQKDVVFLEIGNAYRDLLEVPNEKMFLDNMRRARNALKKCKEDLYNG